MTKEYDLPPPPDGHISEGFLNFTEEELHGYAIATASNGRASD